MSGVEIQAQAADALATGAHLAPLSESAALALILLVVALSTLSFIIFPRSLLALAANAALGIFATIGAIGAFNSGIIVPIITLELAWLIPSAALFSYRYFVTERERREMRHAFSKYVSKDILEEIIRDPSKVKLGGDERTATVFFSDVRGFTTLSESLTATGLVSYLNRYYNVMSSLVISHRGVVDKYIGDAIMAFWGAPLENKHQALDAILASLEMVDALIEFNAREKAAGAPNIDIGIGLNTGPVVAGNVGSSERFDYTVMGDTTNLASRLEGQTKTYGVHLIVSKATRDEILPEQEREHGLLFRELDRIRVKGKKLPVTIFECVERGKKETVAAVLAAFTTAREEYFAGRFPSALAQFEKILTLAPNDGPSRLLLERCRYFLEHPPENWEGVYEFKTK